MLCRIVPEEEDDDEDDADVAAGSMDGKERKDAIDEEM